MRKEYRYNTQSGYALFTSIILTSMLVLVAYAATNYSIKQLLLTTSASESHLAFYVADSGVECALYWDLKNPNNPTVSAFDPNSPTSNITCGGTTSTVNAVSGGGSSVNVAQGKTATQSSTFAGNTVASNAVDGNTDGNYSNNSLTHTNLDANAWWQVDLGSSASISSVVVWNRTDCCSNRLDDYWIFISDTPFGPSDTPATLQSRAGTWSSRQISYPNPSTAITTTGAQGRYVRVQLSGTNYLSLAELQVFSSSNSSSVSTFQIPVGSSCALVTVTKNGTNTTIESKGYNTCNAGNRFERAIRITY